MALILMSLKPPTVILFSFVWSFWSLSSNCCDIFCCRCEWLKKGWYFTFY